MFNRRKVIWNDMRVRKWWQNLLAVTFQQSSSKSMLYCTVKCFSMWQKCIIKFVAFVMNSVISIVSVLCYLFIYLLQLKALWPITPNVIWHFTIATHTPTPHVILRGPHSKFSAQGPEFLATALVICMVVKPLVFVENTPCLATPGHWFLDPFCYVLREFYQKALI